MLYNIYAGVDVGDYQYTRDFETEEEALLEAYEIAIEQYDSSSATFETYEDIIEDYCCENCIDPINLVEDDYEYINDRFCDIRENHIGYYAIPTDKDEMVPVDEIDIG